MESTNLTSYLVTEVKPKNTSGPLPEIIHQFRVPDKRPPRIVSDIFTGLCITPLVLLFVFGENWASMYLT